MADLTLEELLAATATYYRALKVKAMADDALVDAAIPFRRVAAQRPDLPATQEDVLATVEICREDQDIVEGWVEDVGTFYDKLCAEMAVVHMKADGRVVQ
ncbi:unnamed protein product [marine sediment metagenome]|uniref:Uncharacterized protein n=1 Tax=marine sediment metagenome TaxID=412755 RepID=X0TAE9_9ZZZZ